MIWWRLSNESMGKCMFLNQLSNREKNAFISLSVKISEANGVFDELEKEMIQEYCKWL